MHVVKENEVPQTIEGAMLLEQKADFSNAAILYEKLSKTSPRNIKLLQRLMIVYRKLKQYKKEVTVINKAIKIYEQHYTANRKPNKNVSLISKKLNLLLGHTDKKGKPLMQPTEIAKLQTRKNNLLKRFS